MADMNNKKQYSRIVFLDSNAAFTPPGTEICGCGNDLYELAESLDKRPRDWSRERYCYQAMMKRVQGYWEKLELVANYWSEEATKGFAAVLEKHDAGFVLSSEVRETVS